MNAPVRRKMALVAAVATLAAVLSVLAAQPAPALPGDVTSYADGLGVFGIAAGPDGNLWITDANTFSTPSVDRMTPSGDVTRFSTGTGSNPRGITSGPDGKLWFTLQSTP